MRQKRFSRVVLLTLIFLLTMQSVNQYLLVQWDYSDFPIVSTRHTGDLELTLKSAPVSAATESYVESFSATTYRDPVSNVSGWGTGAINLQQKNPSITGSYNTPGYASTVVVEGNYAYVADGSSGMLVINITDLTEPTLAGSYDTPDTRSLAVEGNYAYLAQGDLGLLVLNITNPRDPTLVGSYNPVSTVSGVIVEDSYAFVWMGAGMEIHNFTDPTDSDMVGSIYLSGMVRDAWISGDHAYFACSSVGLQVVDITDITTPTLVGTYNTPEFAYGVGVDGNYAYVADTNDGLLVVNITDPTDPTLAGNYNTPGLAYKVAVEGDFAYVADHNGGLRIVNISDPTSPFSAGSYNTPGSANGIVLAGDHAFVASGSGGLQIIRIADYSAPTHAGNYDTSDYSYGVEVAGNFAYVAAYEQGLLVVNITDPTTPTLAGNYDTPGTAISVCIEGDYAYVADRTSGIQVLNISDPTTPTFAGSYDTPIWADDVEVEGNYAYIADWGWLLILDISDPAAPTFAGYYDPPGNAIKVDVDGNFAYLACAEGGLQIINVTDPTAPILAASYGVPIRADAVAVDGDYAFIVSNGYDALIILNITDPTKPTKLSNTTISGNIDAIAVDGNYAYLGTYQSTLLIYNITDVSAPTFAGTYTTPGIARDVAIVGDDAYVACTSEGLEVVEVRRNRCRPTYEAVGVAQSLEVFDDSFASVIRATVTVTDSTPSGTTIEYELSADNGVHWESVDVGIEHAFVNIGSQLKWRAVLSTTDSIATPTISILSIDFETQLDAPSLISPGDGTILGDNTPTFDWASVSGAGSYFIQLDTAASFDTPSLLNETSDISTFTLVTSLLDDIWFWRVAANDSEGTLGYFSATWTITIDTGAPTWDQPIIDHVIEFGDDFEYDINASDPSSIDKWWLNDTSNFGIDTEGLATNAITLPIDIYGLQVWVNDTVNNIQTTTFSVTVQDTTIPTWDQLPTNQIIEVGVSFSYGVDASDLDAIDHYWINDTIHFAIDDAGLISDAIALPTNIYTLEVRAYDPSNNYCTATITITVEDTTTPTWSEIPSDQMAEFGVSFSYDVDSLDLGGIDYYWINDTTYFSISNEGLVTNNTPLVIGTYNLEIRAYDLSNHYCWAFFTITCADSTPPTWDVEPTDQTLDYSQPLNLQLVASDISGIDHWWINDLVHFEIDENGIITNSTTLSVGTYNVEVRVYDIYDNYLSVTFNVIVTATTTTTTTTTLPDGTLGIILALGLVGVGAIIFVIYLKLRRSS